MKFTHATVDVHIQASRRGDEYKLRLPGYKFTLPGTHLVLVVHRDVAGHFISKRLWVVSEPTTGKRLMSADARATTTRKAAVESAGVAVSKNGMAKLASAVMEFLPKLLGLEVRTPDGVVVTPSQEGGAQ